MDSKPLAVGLLFGVGMVLALKRSGKLKMKFMKKDWLYIPMGGLAQKTLQLDPISTMLTIMKSTLVMWSLLIMKILI